MPRKNRFTREEIISAALELPRSRGSAAVTARSLAGALGSSSKPIFGLFENMDEVQQEVQKAAFAIYQKRIVDAMASGEFPPFKASGMAYIRFAREQKELFKLLFMRDRTGENIPQLRQALVQCIHEDFWANSITGDLALAGDTVLLVMPQDIQAP